MVRLVLSSCSSAPDVVLESPIFRITGGVIWDRLKHGLIASFNSGTWKHHAHQFPNVLFQGRCRLVFGLTREPLVVSRPIEVFSITGPILRADGVPIFTYIESNDMWRNLVRSSWWMGMRIVSADLDTERDDESSAVYNSASPPSTALN